MLKPGAAGDSARRLLDRLPHGVRLALLSAYRRQPLPRWGNLRRTRPFSEKWGLDRGTAIDRRYIEDFLARHADDIRGEGLEVKSADYLRRYGGGRLTAAHVVDIDAANPQATIVADLSAPGCLPVESFDCVILTQTLQYLPDLHAALANVWDSMREGAVLLVSAPTITPIDRALRGQDRWRCTGEGLRTAISAACPRAAVEVEVFGNASVAVAFLMGMAREEMREAQLETVDPDVAVVACARVRKVEPSERVD